MDRARLLPTAVVGSYSMPGWLERVKNDYLQRRISRHDLDEIHDMAVKAAIKDQEVAGVDVVSDGELRRDNMIDYFAIRLPGVQIDHASKRYYYDFYDSVVRSRMPTASLGLVEDFRFLRRFTDRRAKFSVTGPHSLVKRIRNEHYPSEEAYLVAIAEAMRYEYETITKAGITLQIDCPDLGMGRHIQHADLTLAEWRKKAELHVEALNHALANVPPEQVRMHLCWGNYEGPHHCDVALADVIDIVFKARPCAVALEAANPRHAHEWTLFETVKLPDGKVLIPGVIESKSNFIEHPMLVAQRIARYARLVGRENVMAGSDCGFGTWVGQSAVDPDVVWAKMTAMAEGARIASRRFWKS